MSTSKFPTIERVRASGLRKEMESRAKAWLPEWRPRDTQQDFASAILTIAARFESEVAQRFDRLPEKVLRGFLDWLGIQGEGGHAARVPLVFQMKKGAEAILAEAPIQVQATPPQTDSSKAPAPVLFETEAPLLVVPAKIAALVGASAGNDAYYLAPRGISPLAEAVPGPRSWALKSSAQADATQLQLEPPLGLDTLPTLLHRASKRPYQVMKVEGNLVTIDRPLEPVQGGAYSQDDMFDLLDSFAPFDDSHLNAQQHDLYLGSEALLNLPAKATIDVSGLSGAYQWSYWGKQPQQSNPNWIELHPETVNGGIRLAKSAGAVEILKLDGKSSRWLKASTKNSTAALQVSRLTLTVNAQSCDQTTPCPAPKDAEPSTVAVEGIATSTPLVLNQAFFPLGQQPRLFDAFYLGCPEAFSKPKASVRICLQALDATAQSLTAVRAGQKPMLLWVGEDGYLHRMSQLDPVATAQRLKPVKPPINSDGTSKGGQTPLALKNTRKRTSAVVAGDTAIAALIADKDIWLWIEGGVNGTWEPLSALPGDLLGQTIEQVLILSEGAGQRIIALVGTSLVETKRTSGSPAAPWTKLVDPGKWKRIAPVFRQEAPLAGGSLGDGWLAINDDGELHYFKATGTGTTHSKVGAGAWDADVTPLAFRLQPGGDLLVVAKKSAANQLVAFEVDPAHLANPTNAHTVNSELLIGEFDWAATTANGPAVLFTQKGSGSADRRIQAWFPGASGSGAPDPGALYPSAPISDMEGSPCVAGTTLFVPGTVGSLIAIKLDVNGVGSFPLALSSLATAVTFDLPNLKPVNDDVMGVTFAVGDVPLAFDVSLPDPAQQWLEVPLSEKDKVVYEVRFYHPAGTSFDGEVKAVGVIDLDPADPHTEGEHFIRVKPAVGDATIHKLKVASGSVDPAIPDLIVNATFKYTYLTELQTGMRLPLLKQPPSATCASIRQVGAILKGASPRPNPVRFTDTATGIFTNAVLAAPWAIRPTKKASKFTISQNDIFAEASVLADTKDANPSLSWEYFDGQSWWKIDGLVDGTANLRSTGIVHFCVPSGLAETEVAGRKSYWIRARLIGGDYGPETVSVLTTNDPVTGGTIQKIVRSTSGAAPPVLASVTVNYSMCCPAQPDYVLTKDGGLLRDQTAANGSGAQVELFVPLKEALSRVAQITADTSITEDAIYVGLDASCSGGPLGILFLVEEAAHRDAFPLRVDVLLGTGFEAALSEDGTRGLNESGIVVLNLPAPPLAISLFGPDPRYWIRLRPRIGFTGDWRPRILGAYLNAVFATASQTHRNERLGSSDGSPNQTVRLVFPPVLTGSLELRLKEPLNDEEMAALTAKDAAAVLHSLPGGEPGPWVRWTPVPDISAAGSSDRVYSFEAESGTIRFGDARNGRIPPIGANSLVAITYKTLAGDDANRVAAWSQTNLATQLLGIDKVLIPQDAAGGAGPQTPDEVLRFAPANQFARDRALTLADFEALTMQWSRDVAQARAFTTPGGVKLAVVMRGSVPAPSESQRRELRRYLLARAVPDLAADAALEITGPRLVDLQLTLELAIQSLEDSGGVSKEAANRLEALFDPATGGLDSQGWRLGTWPDEADVAAQLLGIAGLEEIEKVSIKLTYNGTTAVRTPTVRTNLDLPILDTANIDFNFTVVSPEPAL